MMDARRPCPDSALLAAFLDGTLAGYERTAVVSHLAECPECRAVAVTVVEFREVEALDTLWQRDSEPPASEPLFASGATRWAREKTRAPAWTAAALVAITALAFTGYFYSDSLFPSWSAQRAVAALLHEAEGTRLLQARVSGHLQHASAYSSEQASSGFSFVRFTETAAALRASREGDYAPPSRRVVGVAALLTGNLDEAIDSLSIAVWAEPSNRHVANDLATAYYERFVRTNRADDLPAALTLVEQALRVEPHFPEALFNRALIITALGLWSEARLAWELYLNVDGQSGWAVEARTHLEQVQRRLAEPADWQNLRRSLLDASDTRALQVAAREHATRLRDLFENELLKQWSADPAAAPPEIVSALNNVGNALFRETGDRYHRDLALRLVRLRSAPPEARSQAAAAFRRWFDGLAQLNANRIDESISTLRAARAQLSRVDSPLTLKIAIELATADFLAGRYQSAIAVLPALRDRAGAQSYTMLAARASWILGLAHFAIEDLAAAERAYEDTLARAITGRDAEARVGAAVLLANLNWIKGDRARAWHYRNEAATFVEGGVSINTRANVLLGAAGDALGAGQYETALVFLAAMLDRGTRLNVVLETQARSQRAIALHRIGRHSEAGAEVAAAQRLLPSIADSRLRARVAADTLTAEAEIKRDVDPAAAIAAAQNALSFPEIADDRLRLARLDLRLTEVYLWLGQLDAAQRSASNGIAALEQFREAADGLALGASDSAWRLYIRAAEVALRQDNLHDAFAYLERVRRAPGLATTLASRDTTLKDVQERLAPDAALIFLNQFDTTLDVWLVRRSHVQRFAVAFTKAQSSALVAAHLDEIRRRIAVPVAGARLFAVLLRPALAGLEGIRTLTFVADAPYHRLAPAALWNEDRNRFLVEDYRVMAAASAADYLRGLDPAANSRRDRRRAAVLRSESAPRSVSLAAVTTAYPSGEMRAPESATPKRMIENLLDRDVVHIAAPILSSAEYPAYSQLVLSDESGVRHSGLVSASRLAAVPNIRTELVSLEPGGTAHAGWDSRAPQMIPRAFLAAGVRHVVTPVAQFARDDIAATWMEFHRQFAAGSNAVDSLRQAQLAALSTSDRRSGPWAALTVFGAAQ
jgi:hypothetical protein